ncbi:MBL fold metallo-hydrolase [Solicola sp. PLA-1-18]|uniref:MBL fold metallo-hydrolase n=1 Tax=Solicola sp. PLA-1-18 TaxID=3380532 RepID=UPI003B7DBA13
MSGEVRIDHVVTSGTFELDGGSWDVDNNVWLIGDDHDVIVIDPAHHAPPIIDAIAGRRLTTVVCTHGHNDHIGVAGDLVGQQPGVHVLLHPDDRMLWDEVYPEHGPTGELSDGQEITVGDATLTVLHTPGHSPGAVCLHAPSLGTVFSGDTLFNGGPGATGRSYSDFDTIIASIRDRLLTLPPETVVRTGHGDSTTIGDESPHLDRWVSEHDA